MTLLFSCSKYRGLSHLGRPTLKFLTLLVMAVNLDNAAGQVMSKIARRAIATSCPASNVRSILIESTTTQPIQMFEFQAYTDSDVEVAQGKTATQSSLYRNDARFAASKAVDGVSSTFSHTGDAAATWEVDLGQDYNIGYISVKNRFCTGSAECLCRLSNATVKLLDSSRGIIKSGSFGDTCGELYPSLNFDPCAPFCLVKKVKLASTTQEPIQIFELQSYSGGVNIALQGSATQSSLYNGNVQFDASKAIDGINSTFSHTTHSNAWLEVALPAPVNVENVVILNRWCRNPSDPTNCLCRLTNSTLTLYSKTGSPVSKKALGNTCGLPVVSQQIMSCSVSASPSISPSSSPSSSPTNPPSTRPSASPITSPSSSPSISPSRSPSFRPSFSPSRKPTNAPSTKSPTNPPSTQSPTKNPTQCTPNGGYCESAEPCCSSVCNLSDSVCENSERKLLEFSSSRNLKELSANRDSLVTDCAHHYYNVGLYALLNHGSHFFLAAELVTKESQDESNNDAKCPSMLALASLYGHKNIFLVPEGTLDGFPTLHLGSATLMNILNAEGNVAPIKLEDWDLTSNTCAHYAVKVARSLNFERTPEVTQFIVENLLSDDGFLQMARSNLGVGGGRILASAAISGEGGFAKYTERFVTSELNIHW